jgi:hypothetical protein
MNFTILSFLFALIVWAQPLCDKKGVQLKEEFSLKAGQELVVKGEKLKIGFREVVEDSRCPEGAQCIWEGSAKIVLRLRKGNGKPSTVELNTAVDPRQRSYMGYEVRLLALRPHPKLNTTIEKKGYVATLVVSKQ